MKTGFLKIALAVSLLFNLSVLGGASYFFFAQRGSWVSPLGVRMPRDKFLFEELSLTPEQLQKMRAKAIPFRAEIDRKRGVIAGKRNQLLELLRAEHPDEGAIQAMVAEIGAGQQEVEEMVAAHLLQAKEILSREQQGTFIDLVQSAIRQGRPGCASMAAE